ncbi:hypothetical protein MAM1_1149c11481 [Mucor ambiguus]|uniref:Uncharacterized protein n=1 Tax=Mucor ambiguus TaxID=91626 RepID=A0A0C9NAR2_9FUNG|nr:hypothetical protein MAM1_1149c11481 [Mucor ambiguus]
MLFLGKLLLFIAAVAVYLLSWCLSSRCCCDYRSLAVLAMLSLGNLALFGAAVVAVYLLSWCLLGAPRFCCCCRAFAVLLMLYRVNLALSAAAVVVWNFWFVLCSVDVPIAEAQH